MYVNLHMQLVYEMIYGRLNNYVLSAWKKKYTL